MIVQWSGGQTMEPLKIQSTSYSASPGDIPCKINMADIIRFWVVIPNPKCLNVFARGARQFWGLLGKCCCGVDFWIQTVPSSFCGCTGSLDPKHCRSQPQVQVVSETQCPALCHPQELFRKLWGVQQWCVDCFLVVFGQPVKSSVFNLNNVCFLLK